MKYKLLSVSTVPAINIGDYIQALAASQFYPQIDGFIEREKLREYKGELCKVIMNAYYMHDGTQWPPSDKIQPLFVATHINSLVRKDFETKESIEYFKRYAPIGCRDYDTKTFLENHGIEAYFSGCLTLTLGKKYKWEGAREGIYFVDPKVTFKNKLEKLYYFTSSYFTYSLVNRIGKQWFSCENLSMSERAIVSKFIKMYKKVFSEDTLINACYISQESNYYNKKFRTPDELLIEAERLIKLYAKAEFVVTSRIHCALPCLGLETPVILINNREQAESSYCRLRGIRELFNVIDWSNEGLIPLFPLNGKLSNKNRPENNTFWIPIADKLIEKCEKFFKQ